MINAENNINNLETLPQGWERRNSLELVESVRIDRNKQVPKSEYQLAGEFPIVDQGQSFVAGWTNHENRVICDVLPLIIFGDHTRCLKFVDMPFALGADGTKPLRARDGVNPRFAYYALSSVDIPSKGYSRHFSVFKEKTVMFCESLVEQKKIAAILFKLQNAISVQKRTLDTLRELKKSTLQKIFTEGLHGKSQSTDLGKIPAGWAVFSLGDLCDENGGGIQTGPFGSQLHASDYELEGTPVVNPTHMNENEIIHKDIPKIGSRNANRLSRHALEAGDILFARRGEIGRHAFVSERESGWICGTGCFLVRMKTERVFSEYTSRFLYSSMAQEWLVAHASGTIMPNLNTKILRACPVVFPESPAEQKKIISIFQTLDKKIGVHERKRDTLNELFRSTLNQLMTAKIRVNNLKIDISEVEE